MKVPKARPQRLKPFANQAPERAGASPLVIWAAAVLLMIGFLSVSMYANRPLTIPAQMAALNEEDPGQPTIGQIVQDCRVMIEMRGRFRCLESTEHRPDDSSVISIRLAPGTLRR